MSSSIQLVSYVSIYSNSDSVKLNANIMLCSSSTLLTIFGGRVDDIEVMLKEERIPDGWESRVREPFGLTFAKFNLTVFRVELGIEGSAGLGGGSGRSEEETRKRESNGSEHVRDEKVRETSE